jgi:hypothetical protein
MKAIRAIASFGAGILVSGVALAADPPDLVGTWKAVPGTYASVRLGDNNDYHPEYKTPNFGVPDEAWSLIIESQNGRAFVGRAESPAGKGEPVVGVVSFDGTRLIMAAEEAGLFGTVDGNQIEICFQDQEDDRSGVSCYVAQKQ